MPTAYGYTRLSQVSDTSIERQTEHIRAYAAEHGYDVAHIYDDGQRASGFDVEREAYQTLRDNVADVDAVIVNDKRRLARDIDEVMRLIPDLRQHGVELHTYQDGQLDLSDPMHAAIEILQAAAAYEEKMAEIEKAREAVAERIERGDAHGQPPFGMQYGPEKRRFVPDPEEIDTVAEICAARDGGATLQTISDDTGVPLGTVWRVLDRREWYAEQTEEVEG